MARTDIIYDMYGNDLVLQQAQIEQDFVATWSGGKLVFPLTLELEKTYNVSIPARYSFDIVAAEGFEKCLFYIEGKDIELKAYQIPLVSLGVLFVYVDADKILHFSNATMADLTVGEARHQNSLMTLVCNPGNYHRFPVSGVGLCRYLHGRMVEPDFASRVQDEFNNDGVTVTDLQYNHTTGEINIKTKENSE